MRRQHAIVSLVTATALTLVLAGCTRPAEGPAAGYGATAPTATAPATTAATAPASAATTGSVPATTAPAVTATGAPAPKPVVGKPISAASRRYAKELGGWSHQGETLYLIVGGSFKSEAATTKALKTARPYFGDMQDYFIVQRSDNFSGMRPGWWILVEAYRTNASAKEQLEFAQRAFASTSIKKATVNTADPIPVYNDLVDFATP